MSPTPAASQAPGGSGGGTGGGGGGGFSGGGGGFSGGGVGGGVVLPTPSPTPDASETPRPSPQPSPASLTFTDTAGHWGAAYIEAAVERGLFNGYPDGSFRPDAPITRAQFLAVLYRSAGSPETETGTPFRDIGDQSEEFQRAIAWGYSQGYINGRSEEVFDPNGNLSRQEAMKILYSRGAALLASVPSLDGRYDGAFSDTAEIAPWAKAGMYWAVYYEIIGGSDVGLEPKAPTTRAQMSKILVNYLDRIGEAEP